MSNFLIRRALPNESTLIVEFQLMMALETENIKLDKEIVTAGVAHIFNNPEKGWYWLAEDVSTNNIVGCFMTLREWSDWRNGSVIWLHSVFVVEQARKSGVFKTMFDFLKNHIQQNNKLKGLRLYVDKTNLKAISAYINSGMNGEHYQLFEWMK